LFLLVGLFGHLLSARTDKRLRTEAQITSALGTGVLGGVDVPVQPRAEVPEERSLARRLRSLVVSDQPWHVTDLPTAVDEAGLEIRYRRVVARLREHLPTGPGRVLVLVTADDREAAAAAARLAEYASETRLGMRIEAVSAARPVVPDDGVAGVLVVVTAGARTAWELVGITEACTDAGHELLGVVVTHLTQPVDEAPSAPADPVLAGAQ
jgi:hypothetical protein